MFTNMKISTAIFRKKGMVEPTGARSMSLGAQKAPSTGKENRLVIPS
jgi:hypothetical protein